MENDGIGHVKLLVAWYHKVYQNLCGRMRQVSTQQVASPTAGRKTDAELSTRTAVDAYFGRLRGETSRSARLRRNTVGNKTVAMFGQVGKVGHRWHPENGRK